MTSKNKTLWLAIVTAVTGWLSYIAIVPPSEQDKFILVVLELCPPGHRGWVGSLLRAVAAFAGFYAMVHASKSGPQTDPKNLPNE